MKKLLSVSIGIPAYNEEENIQNILLRVLSQNVKNFAIKEIIVVSDGSTDNTESKIQELDNSKIILIKNPKRIGQALSQNIILSKFKGDALILLNADIIINKDFVSEMVKPFNENVDLVIARVLPIMPSTFFEKVINYSVEFKTTLFENINDSDNQYLCCGRGRAISKKLGKSLKWKNVFSEDVFAFLYCKEYGFTTIYNRNAVVMYKSPDNLRDHAKQSARFRAGQKELYRFFPNKLIDDQYSIPKYLYIKWFVIYLLKNPIYFIGYIVINIITRFTYPTKQVKAKWSVSKSSKTLSYI